MTRCPLSTFLDEGRITQRIAQLADELLPRLRSDPIVIGVMKGGFMFTADLVRALSRLGVAPRIDFMTVASYGSATASSGSVKILLDHDVDLHDQQVLLVDDIIDSGHTFHALQRHLINKGVAELISIVLLDKPSRRQVPVTLDAVGFEVPDLFFVGYGMDHAGNHRELPCIAWIPS
ncbi:MAG: hypoxanthine phosphoribosyltransferase [Magnetococcales bacterium]|nr:hypoxanthine phosphoribosyltransferase [Magnetococcales bacterium]MBF0150942.1 hypoxanthine phosphoribosyltransferase [Magnetococcales bacterium]MBF0631967.1 hypoxanthine phosphoribosyltransferase [Magnetococcales bacterium]